MLALDFTNTGYIYMVLIWMLAPTIGVYLALKKKRNPFFWGVLCLIIPMALFAIGGMRAPGEPLPPMFREDPNATSEASEKTADDSANGSVNGKPLHK